MDEKEYDFIIEAGEQPERIDVFLARKLSISRSMVQKLIDSGHVHVNNAAAKAGYKLKADDRVNIKVPIPRDSAILPQEIPLKIVYEDRDIVVIDKPAGMIVHPTPTVKTDTLVNALLYHIKDLSSIGGEYKPGIVHRLDKDTSGLIVVAKNDQAHIELSRQIKNRTVKKTYVALVFGDVKPDMGTIEKPIGRDPEQRKKMAVILGGRSKSREAITSYKVMKKFKGYTLLELDLKTGRTHQIRVHLSHQGYPVVGDSVYTKRKNLLGAKRQLLHSYKLELVHPVTGQKMEFKSEMPEDFKEVLSQLE